MNLKSTCDLFCAHQFKPSDMCFVTMSIINRNYIEVSYINSESTCGLFSVRQFEQSNLCFVIVNLISNNYIDVSYMNFVSSFLYIYIYIE